MAVNGKAIWHLLDRMARNNQFCNLLEVVFQGIKTVWIMAPFLSGGRQKNKIHN